MSHIYYKAYLILVASITVLEAFQYLPKPRQKNYCLNHEVGEFVKNPNDCRLFYLCGENNEVAMAACPPNMLFNPESKLCDVPENVNCDSATTTLPSTTTAPPTSISESFTNIDDYCFNLYIMQPSSNALIFLANPQNCQQYYMCYHGRALLQECSRNLHWNSKKSNCDLPSNANCVARDDSNTMEALTTLDEPIWGNGIKCPSYGEHIFPNLKRCEFFIYCIKGHGILQQCPFYHYFDVETGRCKFRTKAVCVKDLSAKFRKNKY